MRFILFQVTSIHCILNDNETQCMYAVKRQIAVWHILKCSIKLTCINAFYSCYKMPSLHHFLKAYVECIFNWGYFINIKSDVSFNFSNKHKKHDKYKHSDIYIYMSYLSLYVFQIVPQHLFFVTSLSLPYLQCMTLISGSLSL